MMVVMDQFRASEPSLGASGLCWPVFDGSGMMGEQAGCAVTIMDGHRDAACSDSPRHILHALQPLVPIEAVINSDSEGCSGKCSAQVPHQRAQQTMGTARRRTVAGPQHDGDQILLRFVVEGERGDQW